jgi:SAM-dependent methyltransferase
MGALRLAVFRAAVLPIAALLAGVMLLAAGEARSADDYRYASPSPDGIGKFYRGREIAQVMGFEGAAWLDRPERERDERPDWLIEELALAPDMTVADIGAGSGYLERRMAPRLPHGKIYAVDVQPPMVALLRELAQRPEFAQVIPVRGAVDDARLPAASVDLAVLVDVYHELEFPAELLRSVVRALKPGGRLVLVEYRAEDPAVPIKALHKMSEHQVRLEMAALPLDWVRTSERLPLQHVVIFRRR